MFHSEMAGKSKIFSQATMGSLSRNSVVVIVIAIIVVITTITIYCMTHAFIRRKSTMESKMGDGRIKGIIKELRENSSGATVNDISEVEKLKVLCHALQVSPQLLDLIIHANSPVMRTVKGHAFESYFGKLMDSIGVNVDIVGGDDAIDCRVNGLTLQLKTPHAAGTSEQKVSYKTHKTHGPKSELESMEYYHDVRHFADYLVGLISYDPLNIIILEQSELPRHPDDKNKIRSPFTIDWQNHPGLNAWHRLGIQNGPSTDELTPSDYEKLPLTSIKIGMSTDIILNTILSEENFRIWDMSIRGFAREEVFKAQLMLRKIGVHSPSISGKRRADKADFTIKTKIDGHYKFFQMKGVSTNNCIISGSNSIVVTETRLTRGRQNDHPTQSRLYLSTDFDYLIIGLDPSLSAAYQKEIGVDAPNFDWQFYCIPTEKLVRHKRFPRRLNGFQSFKYSDLQPYLIDDQWYNEWASEKI